MVNYDLQYNLSAFKVGNHTAKFIDWLVKNKDLDLKKVHIIGHSLGAHTAGFSGKYLKSGTVARITGNKFEYILSLCSKILKQF